MKQICLAWTILTAPTFLLLAAPAPKESPLPPVTKEQRKTSSDCLKILALGMHGFHDDTGSFPGNVPDKKGKAQLSWRVQILPYIDEEELYKQFRLNEPWDSEHNKKLIAKIPKPYQPVRGRFGVGETFYQMFAGEKGFLRPTQPLKGLAGITDGCSNTFMIAEGGKPVIWTKPDDIDYDGQNIPKLGGMFDGEFQVAMADGSVKSIIKNADPKHLHWAIQPDDGATPNFDKLEGKSDTNERASDAPLELGLHFGIHHALSRPFPL